VAGIYHIASDDYFRALNIPLRAGRFFDGRDTSLSQDVIILNESLARKAFPNENPIGKFVTMPGGNGIPHEIVGVVGDSDLSNIGSNMGQEFYLPLRQRSPEALRLGIRTSVDPTSLTAAVRDAVRQCDLDLPIYTVKTMDQIVAEASAKRRFATLSLGAFALVALLLSSLGIYSVMSYIVEQRTHEIGVRMALGAQTRDVWRLIVRQGMTMVLIGIPIGIAGALVLTMFLRDLLFGVSTLDPSTFTLITILLAVVALLACYAPARRAIKVDPMIALRCE
jgi:putative ABC transport system permease protein